MIVVVVLFLFQVLVSRIYCGENGHKIDQFIIPCHSTDFVCFQMQYKYLRDLVYLGCEELEVPVYQQYYFQYSDTNTCVKVSGVEASDLVGIGFDGKNKLLTLTITMPVRFQQGWPNWTAPCNPPEKAFTLKGPHSGPYRKFAANATMVAQFPFTFEEKAGQLHLVIEEEDLDVTLDVPDLSSYNRSSQLETRIYEWSEWAHEMVQHVDVPEHVMAPYLHRIKAVYNKLPLKKLIVLYPSEEYQDLRFKYAEVDTVQ